MRQQPKTNQFLSRIADAELRDGVNKTKRNLHRICRLIEGAAQTARPHEAQRLLVAIEPNLARLWATLEDNREVHVKGLDYRAP